MVKAKDMSLKELLSLRNEEGENFLKDRRMIISSADAWGVLESDLIVALGIERAQRFLLRYGWRCGVHEAEIFKDLYQWDDDVEWLLAGQKFHNISGRVFSVPVKLDVNMKTGLFDVEGYWFNSYEAKQYLRHFSPHNEPVCYFLVGYAGGYCSAIVGKKIIFKEVECVGKGDQHCRYVGKTLDLWGDEIAEHLCDYEEEDLADELDRAYKRIEKQREILKRSITISQELTQIILQEKGFDAIVRTLGDSLQCSVVIENQMYENIAEYGNTTGVPLHKILDDSTKLKDKASFQKVQKMLNERVTVQIEFTENWGTAHTRLVTPIVLRDQIYGFISLIKPNEPFGEWVPAILERSANICAIQMLNEQTAIETEQRMKGDLLDELLEKPVAAQLAARRSVYLGYNLNKPHFVFVFHLDTQEDRKGLQHEVLSNNTRRIKELLIKHVESAGCQLLISSRLDRVHAVIPEEYFKKQNIQVKAFAENLANQIEQFIRLSKIMIGVSSVCVNQTKFYSGFKEANKALEIAKLRKKMQTVVLSSELGHLSILLDARRPEELETYATSQLGALIDYDQQYQTEFLKTLYAYVENECNLYKTARALNVSISGMRYRLNRIKELTNFDMANSSTRFEVQMALEICVVLGKLHF